jgi:hypothetical protein
MTGAGTVADFGVSPQTTSVGGGGGVSFLGFNAVDAVSSYKFGRGSAGSYGGGIAYDPSSGYMYFVQSGVTGWAGASFVGSNVLILDKVGNALFTGTVSGTNLSVAGHAIADLFLPSGVCAAGTVLAYLSTGAPTCVTNGSGMGIGCSGTCSSPNWAVFTDSTHVTNASYPPAQASDITTAVNAAVSGTTNYVAKFTGTNSIGNSFPLVTGSTTSGIPVTDIYNYLTSFMPPTRIPLYSGSMMNFSGTIPVYSGAIYINTTDYVSYSACSLSITWKQTAGAAALVILSTQSGGGLGMTSTAIPAVDGSWYHSSITLTRSGPPYSGIFYAHVDGQNGSSSGVVGEITVVCQ